MRGVNRLAAAVEHLPGLPADNDVCGASGRYDRNLIRLQIDSGETFWRVHDQLIGFGVAVLVKVEAGRSWFARKANDAMSGGRLDPFQRRIIRGVGGENSRGEGDGKEGAVHIERLTKFFPQGTRRSGFVAEFAIGLIKAHHRA